MDSDIETKKQDGKELELRGVIGTSFGALPGDANRRCSLLNPGASHLATLFQGEVDSCGGSRNFNNR